MHFFLQINFQSINYSQNKQDRKPCRRILLLSHIVKYIDKIIGKFYNYVDKYFRSVISFKWHIDFAPF